MYLVTSLGRLRHSRNEETGTFKLIVEIDPQIAAYARALIPKYYVARPQKYSPHITVIRNEFVKDVTNWGNRDLEQVSFQYSPVVQRDHVYYWLNVYCDELTEIRISYGLPASYRLRRPPSGEDCYHCTIANQKKLEQT